MFKVALKTSQTRDNYFTTTNIENVPFTKIAWRCSWTIFDCWSSESKYTKHSTFLIFTQSQYYIFVNIGLNMIKVNLNERLFLGFLINCLLLKFSKSSFVDWLIKKRFIIHFINSAASLKKRQHILEW